MWQERRAPTTVHRANDPRQPYERDRARVIHSAAFRRLQSKTQILGTTEGDFHRTRLTHSMEVAQIGRGLLLMLQSRYPEQREWLPSIELLETISLAHDLGHPPFGHGGEAALNEMMHEYGGFEANGQTLRQLTRLEAHTPTYGLDLTRRSLLGVVKYPVYFEEVARTNWPTEQTDLSRRAWIPPKCIFQTEAPILDWLLKPFCPTDQQRFRAFQVPTQESHGQSVHLLLDTSLMELADDIAYGVHDLEDAVALRLITRTDWQELRANTEELWWQQQEIDNLEQQLFDRSKESGSWRKRAVGGLVHLLVNNVYLAEDPEFKHPLLRYRAKLSSQFMQFLQELKQLVYRHVILSRNVQSSTYRGHHIVTTLFQILSREAELLLPQPFQSRWKVAGTEAEARRVIADYVAGMTDSYANRMYERLLEPGKGSVFDRL